MYREDRLTPPVWDASHQNYNDWRFCVELWSSACDRAKISQADRSYLLFAKLKDVKRDSLGAKLVTAAQLGKIDVFGDNGVKQILAVLDERFQEDQLALKKKAWHAFINTKRETDQEIDKYIDNYEENVASLRKLGRDLDDETLALQLMENASLTDELSQLVLSGIDEKKDNIFDQAKRSMRKYFGSDKTGLSVKGNITIKEEAFNATEDDTEEAMYTYNRRARGSGRGRANTRGRGGGHGRGYQQSARYSQQRPQSTAQTRARYNSNARAPRGGTRRRETNPLDDDGYPMTCHICGSIYHFAGRNGVGCPESYENLQNVNATATEEADEDANICDIPIKHQEVFLMRSSEEALLDSCCSANVMGKQWKDIFIDAMSNEDKSEICYYKGGTTFRFGGEPPVRSTEKIKFPCYVFGKRSTMVADVVDRDIPLLISKPEMKTRGFILDFNNETLTVDGSNHVLQTTSTGHFKIPLWQEDEEVNVCVTDMSEIEQRKTLLKLHRQFRHHSAKATEDILRNAGILNEDVKRINKEVVDACDICKRYKKTPARPVVSLPMAKQFNDVVAMDLKIVQNNANEHVYFIHFIDMFTRFSKARRLTRKLPRDIVKAFITTWIDSGFGAPNKVIVDNGGEFDNPEYLDIMEQFNIEVCATGAESPWSNGVCERNHAVVDLMVEKMMLEDNNLKVDEALAHAVSAKNALQNHNGFTPIQLW